MNNTIIQAIKHMNTEIVNDSITTFDDILVTEGEISYNAATGEFLIGEDGKYLFFWSVTSQTSILENGLIFSVFIDNIEIKANTSFKTGELTGFGVLDISNTPKAVTLVNKTGNTVYLSVSLPIKVNFMIYRLPDEKIPMPYIDLSLTTTQLVTPDEAILFANVLNSSYMGYEPLTRLISILEPSVYQITLFFFSDATNITMRSMGGLGNRVFSLPSGYGYKVITFIYEFTTSDYIGFFNSSNSNINIGNGINEQNGGVVITKIANI